MAQLSDQSAADVSHLLSTWTCCAHAIVDHLPWAQGLLLVSCLVDPCSTNWLHLCRPTVPCPWAKAFAWVASCGHVFTWHGALICTSNCGIHLLDMTDGDKTAHHLAPPAILVQHKHVGHIHTAKRCSRHTQTTPSLLSIRFAISFCVKGWYVGQLQPRAGPASNTGLHNSLHLGRLRFRLNPFLGGGKRMQDARHAMHAMHTVCQLTDCSPGLLRLPNRPAARQYGALPNKWYH